MARHVARRPHALRRIEAALEPKEPQQLGGTAETSEHFRTTVNFRHNTYGA